MIKEWATVVSWHNGVAQVHCDVKASCSSCASRAGCGSRVLNKLGPQTSHTISVPCEQPLAAGQKVELGIAESSLLGSALLVYMAPLVGLFVMASIFQVLFASDIASLCGALLGGVGGFLVARGLSPQLAARQSWQPVILSVGFVERGIAEQRFVTGRQPGARCASRTGFRHPARHAKGYARAQNQQESVAGAPAPQRIEDTANQRRQQRADQNSHI